MRDPSRTLPPQCAFAPRPVESSTSPVEFPTVPQVRALEHVRRMKGGAQSHLMRASDGHYYVVKFQNNPQHLRVLVNELLATELAARMGLPTAPVAIVEVSEKLIRLAPELCIELRIGRRPCLPGLHFGSRYLGHVRDTSTTLELWPRASVVNSTDFIGMLVFDKWTCNTDSRQVVFVRRSDPLKYRAHMIDQGFCFDGATWTFPDSPIRSLHSNRAVYEEIEGFHSFEPWLSQLEKDFNLDMLLETAAQIPTEWLRQDDHEVFRGLLEKLNRRRMIVREGLFLTCKASPHVFRRWPRNIDTYEAEAKQAAV